MSTHKLEISDITTITENRIEIVQELARNGPQPPRDVAEAVGKTSSAVTNSFQGLREKGWIEYAYPDGAAHRLSDRGLTVAGMIEEYLTVYDPAVPERSDTEDC
jgi:DNA-binding Lrp family transcriptional regulator